MAFHRLNVPGYTGGLPGGYDYINDPSANGDPGAPAPADGKKGSASAPGDENEGTYFVAFSEPADAIFVNRPAQALAENTDFLDDLLHADIAVPTYFDVASGHGGTSSVVLTGDVFVGTGVSNTSGNRNQLVQIVDPTTERPLVWQVSAGPPVVHGTAEVFLIHDGSSVNQVGNGFYTNPTVQLTGTIPDTSAFRVLFYVRGNIANLADSSYSRLQHLANGLTSAFVDIADIQTNYASLSAFNTFTGPNTFNSVVRFETTTILEKSALVPAFTNTDILSRRVLIFEFRVCESPAVYARLYKVRDSSGNTRGFELTYNAKYTSDTAPNWASDTTSTSHNPTRLKFQGALAGISSGIANEGLFFQALDNSTLGGGTWNETVWVAGTSNATNVRQLAFDNGRFVSGEKRNAVAAFASLFPASGTIDAAAHNPYKLLFELPSGGTQKVRIYSGNDDDGHTAGPGGTGGLGHLAIVHNAIWNHTTSLWNKDDTTQASLGLFFRTTADPGGISGLGGSVFSDTSTKGQFASSVYLLTMGPTGSPWGGSSWTLNSGSSGHLRIAGEYGYAAGGGGKTLVYYPNILTARVMTGSSWLLDDTHINDGSTEGFSWSTDTPSDVLFIPVELPYGALITGIGASIKVVATSVTAAKIELYKQQDVVSGGVIIFPTVHRITQVSASHSSGLSVLSSASINEVVDNSTYRYYFKVTHGDVFGTETFYNVHVNYTARVNAPGPGATTLTLAY